MPSSNYTKLSYGELCKSFSVLQHHIIILPGLGDEVFGMKLLTNWWKFKGIIPHVLRVGWRNKDCNLDTKIDDIVSYAKELSKTGFVSIIGTSAGGSMAFNAFTKKPDIFHKAISVCGRLRAGNHRWRSLERRASTSNLFKQSVLSFEKRESTLPRKLRSKMLTISPRFGDELVPSDTNKLKGATNIQIPTIEHLLSITLSLTLFSKIIFSHIKE